MIRRLRLRVPVYISALLLLAGIALVAQATTPVTRSEMESFVYVVVAGAGVCVVGSFWILLTYINGRVEAHISRLERAVEEVGVMMRDHHLDPLAHPVGSANRLEPINRKLDSIDHALTELITEHRVIRDTEDEVCALIRKNAAARRRTDSPEEDHTDERDLVGQGAK